MTRTLPCTALVAIALPAAAQETVDVGLLTGGDVEVVQNALYTRAGKIEIGGHVGLLPFDNFVVSPKAEFSFDWHATERVSVSAMLGGGYGLATQQWNDLNSGTSGYPLAPDAYRYLSSILVGATWAPLYAKMSANGRKVVHYDVFFSARVGVTIEQSVLDDSIAAAPTGSLGLGSRFFLRDDLAVRVEVRDDLMGQYRSTSGAWAFKQNIGFTVGVVWLGGGR